MLLILIIKSVLEKIHKKNKLLCLTIEGYSPLSNLSKQKYIANETLNFLGLAEKLGLTAVGQELEKLSLQVIGKK